MNVKSFLIGAAVAIAGAVVGIVLCCTLCCKKCDKPMPMPPCPQEQQCQKPGQPGQRPEGPRGDFKGEKCKITKMAEQLNLTEEQKQQMKAINDASKDAIRAAKEKAESEIEAILTDEQKTELAKIKAAKCDKKKFEHEEE